MFKLYSAARSSASFRMRIALNLKGLPFEVVAVDLRKGDQSKDAFRALNPQELVPLLDDGSAHLTQSLASMEYLEEKYPQPPLLPHAPADRAYVRSVALAVACEIHPLNNLRVLKYLTDVLKVTEEQKTAWYHHWVTTGLTALEHRLATEPQTGRFCHGDQPGFADISLVPQVANARRFKVDLAPFPTIVRIDAACNEIEAFRKAAPAVQPDAE